MRTMICKQLGGPCDLPLRGSTADEVIKAQDRHPREAVAMGDQKHESALQDMKSWWKRPAAVGWYRQVKRDYAGLAED